jgi:hypothetical protein
MKRYVIGDIHGKDFWKEVQSVYKEGDEVVFVGDYFDNKGVIIPFDVQLQNFYALMDFALDVNAICLYGNHDLAYLDDCSLTDGTFTDPQQYRRIRQAFMEHQDSFQICHTTPDGYLISHAGVSKAFCDSVGITNPAELNNIGLHHFRYSNSSGLSPLWIRPEQLQDDTVDGYTQVVGHTVQEDKPVKIGNVWYIDCCGKYILELGKPEKVYDKSAIMRKAHEIRKETGWNMSTALKQAWSLYKGD